ncbi:MAG: restriction endonuclease subunit S [Methanothrix sp.]|nr:restriction endonuclease subunit S [Methanothrix sp.]
MEPIIPRRWAFAKLGEICRDTQYGWTTSAAKEGNLHLLRTTDITSGVIDWDTVPFCREEPPNIKKYLLRDGDIVISRAGSVGHSHLVKNPERSIFASYLIRFEPLIHEKYLYYFLKSPDYWKAISEKSLGIAVPNVNASKLKQIQVPIPPLAEQHRIVARIEELFSHLDAGVLALQRAKAQLQRYRQAVLKAAVEGRLTEGWRKAHPEVEPAEEILKRISKFKPHSSEQSIDGNEEGLPNGWSWATMEQVASRITSGSRGWAKYYSEFGAIFIRAQDIKTDKLLLDQAAFVEIPSNSEGTRTRVQLGDILIVITGANVTKSAIVESDLGEAYVSQHVGLMRPATIDLAPYLYTYIIAPKYGRGVLKKQTYGAGKPGLNLDNIRELLVRLPPLSEQKAITDEVERCISIAEKVEASFHYHIKHSDRLRQSILKRAFEGKLVPQDPGDEPASLLLERIRAERTKETPRRGRKSNNSTSQMRLAQ